MNYSTYLGGSDIDFAYGIEVDDSTGEFYVVGYTYSSDFVMENSLYGSLSGEKDGFVVKYESDGSKFLYSTYLGGSAKDEAIAVMIDQYDYCYVVGTTNSSDYPKSAQLQNQRKLD